MRPQAADGEGARGSRARRSCAPTPSRLETYDGRVEQLELTKGLELEMKSLAEQLGWEKEDLEEKLEEKKAKLARVTDTRPGRGRHAETQGRREVSEAEGGHWPEEQVHLSVPARMAAAERSKRPAHGCRAQWQG